MKSNRTNNLTIFFILFATLMRSQIPGHWVWMNGYDSTNTSKGKFGTKGVPSATNTPPGLYESCSWTDTSGCFWLFGGNNIMSPPPSFSGSFSDMWKYNPVTNQWAWMKGPGIPNTAGIYGTKGVPSSLNNPGSRSYGACCWRDNNGKFWMYGGWGYDAFGNTGDMSDLWRFDPVTLEWTWMKGPNTANVSGVYGTKGIPAAANNPEPLEESNCTWVDSLNNLWMYGGLSLNAGLKCWNSLWKYSISTNNWTWMWGTFSVGINPVYGVKGVEASSNDPGSRVSYCTYYKNGRLYLYGARKDWFTSYYNDVWSYNISTGNWRWEAGVTTLGDPGSYMLKCDTSGNFPASRIENRTVWTGADGFYMGNNDLWFYNITDKKFIWLKGNGPAFYGTKGISNTANLPPYRLGGAPWKDKAGNLWLFGGNQTYTFNDLWRFTPDYDCTQSSTDDRELNKEVSVMVFPNPNNGTFSLHFKIVAETKFEIYNILGQKIYESSITNDETLFDKKLDPGIYTIFLRDKNSKTYSTKIVVQ